MGAQGRDHWSTEDIAAECEAWRSGARFPPDDDALVQLGRIVAANWPRWWAEINSIARQAQSTEELSGPSEVIGAALVQNPPLLAAVVADARDDVKLMHLAATVIDAETPGAWPNGSQRVVEAFGVDAVATACLAHLAEPDDDDGEADEEEWRRRDGQLWRLWSFNVVTDLASSDVVLGWELVLALIAGSHDDEVLAVVAAGPLEDYVRHHAATAITRIESQAATDARFKTALAGIWVWSALPSTLFERIAAAAGDPLDRPAPLQEASQRRALDRRVAELTAIVNDEHQTTDARDAALEELARVLDVDEA